jgi:hypothetical protein
MAIWRELEDAAKTLNNRFSQLSDTVGHELAHPETTQRALRSLLDDLSGWAWDLEIAAQQVQRRRPTPGDAERAVRYAFKRLADQLSEWGKQW